MGQLRHAGEDDFAGSGRNGKGTHGVERYKHAAKAKEGKSGGASRKVTNSRFAGTVASDTAASSKGVTRIWCGKSGHKPHQCKKEVPPGDIPGSQAGMKARPPRSLSPGGGAASSRKGSGEDISQLSASQD